MVEKIFFVKSEVRSVTAAILTFTFSIAVAVASAMAVKAAALAPLTLATSSVTCVLISAKCAVLVKSRLTFSMTFSFIIVTTESKTVVNAFCWLAPEPSAAAANAFITTIIWWLAISTASASAALTFAAKALKLRISM